MSTRQAPRPKSVRGAVEQRVLIAAPLPGDVAVLSGICRQAGFETHECATATELCREIEAGAATAVVAEEFLVYDDGAKLAQTLARQPEWSDFPLVLMTYSDNGNGSGQTLLGGGARSMHAIVLERPIRKETLVSAVRAAAQSRAPQYKVRDELFRRRQTEQALRESEERLARDLQAMKRLHELVHRLIVCEDMDAALQEALVATIDITGADFGNIQLFSAADNSLEIVVQQGFRRDFLEHFAKVVAGDDSACARALQSGQRVFIKDIEKEPEFTPHFEVIRSAGYRAVQSTPLKSHSGEPLGVLSTHYKEPQQPSDRDLRLLDLYAQQAATIIERTQSEQALRKSEEHLRLAAEAAHFGAYDFDPRRGEATWSDELRTMLQYDGGTTIDTETVLKLIHPEDREAFVAVVDQASRPDGPGRHEFEFRIVLPDGRTRWVRDVGSTIYESEGESRRAVRVIGTVQDITDRKTAELALMAWNESLEEQVAQRTTELRSQNWQLRQLATQLATVEQRERRKLAEMLHDGLQQILVAAKMQLSVLRSGRSKEAVSKLSNLLDDAVATSRSLAYELSPPPLRNADLPQALDWLVGWFRDNSRFTVDLEVDDRFPELDDDMKSFLFNVIRELLLNAVKHSGCSSASVALRSDSTGAVGVRVSDEGRGVEPTVTQAHGRQLYGLGLISIRERVAALGGDFSIESRPGAGATFDIWLPINPDRAPALLGRPDQRKDASQEAGSNGLVRVLIADDHGIVREGLAALLEGHTGIQLVGEACDGVEAVEKTKTLRPDVVLMDVNMPRMDGIDATREIAERYPKTSVIGLSLHDEAHMGEAMLEAGASAFLPKADGAEKLVETIQKLSQT